VYPGLTALENLAFWKNAQGLRLAEADLMKLLERVGLERHAHERAGIFSRGMAQRLNLARALLPDPELLLLDEPGTGLDSRAAAMLREEIARARQRGAGVVWISHDVAADAPLADRVLTLSQGRLGEADQGAAASC
jgi:heme exporter protein A